MRFLKILLGNWWYVNPISEWLKKRREEKELRNFAKSFYKNMSGNR
jgi:hypothetical protein